MATQKLYAGATLRETRQRLALTQKDFAAKLGEPRAVWIMVPAAHVDSAIADLAGVLDAGDTIIDGGNSYYRDDMHRSARLSEQGIHYIDVGTSGGVWGLENGYCLMVGGSEAACAARAGVCGASAANRSSPCPTA